MLSHDGFGRFSGLNESGEFVQTVPRREHGINHAEYTERRSVAYCKMTMGHFISVKQKVRG